MPRPAPSAVCPSGSTVPVCQASLTPPRRPQSAGSRGHRTSGSGGTRPLSDPPASPAGAAHAGEAPGRGREGPVDLGRPRRGALGQGGAGAPRAPRGGAGAGGSWHRPQQHAKPLSSVGTRRLPSPRRGPAAPPARKHGPSGFLGGMHPGFPARAPRGVRHWGAAEMRPAPGVPGASLDHSSVGPARVP